MNNGELNIPVAIIFGQKNEKRRAAQWPLNGDISYCLTVLVWDVEEPTHCSERVGDKVPGVIKGESF